MFNSDGEPYEPTLNNATLDVEGPNGAPTAEAGEDQTVSEEESVTLDASNSSDPNGDDLSYSWTQTSGQSVNLSDTSAEKPTFTAPEVGSNQTLTFEVEVSDGQATSTDTVGVTVQNTNQAPNASFSVDPSVSAVDEEVSFDASGSSDDGTIQSYDWTFGDGTTANGSTPSHTYTGSGTYEVNLTVTDDEGATDTATREVTVLPPTSANLTVSVTDDDNTLAPGETTTAEIAVTDANRGVGAAEFGVELTDPSVANITNFELPQGPPSDNSTLTPDSANIKYAFSPGLSTGEVTIVNVTLQASAGGDTAIEIDENDQTGSRVISDKDGLGYTLETVGSATLTVNTPPTAKAGSNQTVDEGTIVTLNASSSSDQDGDSLNYSWTQTGGESVNLSATSAVDPTFTAPSQVAEETTLTFEVAVSDSQASSTDTVSVTVEPVNDPPTADAGEDRTVDEEADVTLDASNSSDPDEDDLSYSWTQTGGNLASNFTGAGTPTPSFTAPTLSEETTLTFEVEVSDGQATSTDTVDVTVEPVNDPPTAEAGEDQTVDEGESVTLDASDSSDPNPGDSLNYDWTVTDSAGTDIALSNASAPQPTFTAPSQVAENTTLTFEVAVTDESGLSETDTVSVTVQPVNEAPTAEAGEDQSVDEGTTATLDASGSSDPDPGDTLGYDWTVTDSAGTNVSLSDASAVDPTFTAPSQVAEETTLTFEVAVTDEGGETDTDTVSVTVEPVNDPPTAEAGEDQTVDEETAVTLDASGSSDPDPAESLGYSWTVTDSAGTDISLSDASAPQPTFTAPTLSEEATLTFEVEVTDSGGLSETDEVNVTVQPVNEAPSAETGEDQSVDEGTNVTLDASGSSDPDPNDTLGYSWTVTDSAGTDISLSDASAVQPTFAAPSQVAENTTLIFEVTVDDGNGATATDNVSVTIQPVNEAPSAETGEDQSVDEGTTVPLDASGSSDPDPADSLGYDWTVTDSAGTNITLSNASVPQPTFAAPSQVAENTTLTFSVAVSDEDGETDTDEVNVTVEPVNDPPTAEAGEDQTVDEGENVTLDASNSSDPDPAETLGYEWNQTSGESVTLSDASTAQPTLTAPSQVAEETTLTFEVAVTDKGGETDTDTVSVTVQPVNEAPSAEAGEDQLVNERTNVALDASNSSDPDPGDTLGYDWTVTDSAGTNVTLSNASVPQPTFTAPEVSENTTLTFEVEVTDEGGENAADEVDVTVQDSKDVSIELDGRDNNNQIAANGTSDATYDVVVDGVDTGVGAFDITVSTNDSSVAELSDASVTASGSGSENVTVTSSEATLRTVLRDTQDVGRVAVATVTLDDVSPGTVDVAVSVDEVGGERGIPYDVTSEESASLEVIQLEPLNENLGTPTDPDDDGEYEDANGDDSVDIADVQTLFANEEDAAGQANSEVFDLNDDGQVGVTDAQRLFAEEVLDDTAPVQDAGSVAVELSGEGNNEIAAGAVSNATYNVVVGDVTGGVGVFDITVSATDAGVAELSDATITASGNDLSNVTVTDSGATLRAVARDTEDDGNVTVAAVTLDDVSPGTVDITVGTDGLGDESGNPYAVSSEGSASLEVIQLEPVDETLNTPTDPDDDGEYEDTNGDGEVNIADVQALFANEEDAEDQDNSEAFDLNDDGQVGVTDAQRLFFEEVLS